MSWSYIPGDLLARSLTAAERVKGLADEDIRRPLWEFRPDEIKHVIHERRVRFGWDIDDEGDIENG